MSAYLGVKVQKVKSFTENSQKATENEQLNKRDFTESSQKENENEQLNQRKNGSNSAATGDQTEVDGVSDKFQKSKDMCSITDDESDGLSDIDDVELPYGEPFGGHTLWVVF